MLSLWHGQSRQPTEVRRSGLSASGWASSSSSGQSKGYEERQPHGGVFGKSTMDVSRLFLPELRVARLFPQLQSRRQLRVSWKQWWWQSCEEAGSASDFRGLPLGRVRKVAGRRWWSRMRLQPRPRSRIAWPWMRALQTSRRHAAASRTWLSTRLLPEDVRVKFEEWYNSVKIEAKASVDPYSEVLSQGASGYGIVGTGRDDVRGVQLSCCQSSFPLPACCAVRCGVSDEQESRAAAGS